MWAGDCFERECGIDFHVVTGLLGLEAEPEQALANEVTVDHPAAIAAWQEIDDWLDAVRVKKVLNRSRIGFLGHTYPGMMDMYSDFTQHTAFLGVHIEVLEMEDVQSRVDAVGDDEIAAVKKRQKNCLRLVNTVRAILWLKNPLKKK
jgi:L-arabinose isomerase